jgi:hypothetical protein
MHEYTAVFNVELPVIYETYLHFTYLYNLFQTASRDNMAPKRSTGQLQTRCGPGPLPKLAKLLPKEAIAEMDSYGLSKMLKFKLDGLASRVMCRQLMEVADVDAVHNRIELKVREGGSLWITPEVVQHVLDLPTGSCKELPEAAVAEATEEYNRMYQALKHVVAKYRKEKKDPKKKLEEENDDAENGGHDEEDDDAENSGHDEQDDDAGNDGHDEQNAGNDGQAAAATVSKQRDFFNVKNITLLFEHCQKEDVANLISTKMLIRLYLGVVVEKFLLPVNYNYVSTVALRKVHHLEKI